MRLRELVGAGMLVAAAVTAVAGQPAEASMISTPYTFAVGESRPITFTGDGEPTIIRDGADLYVIGVVSPSSAPPQTPRIFKGTSMDNLVRQPDGILDSSYASPRGERYWWNAGGWIDATGKWHVPTHVEFNFPGGGRAPMKRVGLSTSTDKGRHWHYEGDILTSDNSYDINAYQNYYDYGVGEPSLYVDTAGGYFYVWLMNTWFHKTDPTEYASSMRVARAPISGKMAPGTWHYFRNGTWTEPGLGGRSSDLLPNSSSVSVVFNTYLNKYVLITSKLFSNNDTAASYMATATDLAQQNWTGFHKLDDFTDHYNVITNIDGNGVGTVGQSMRWYSSGFTSGQFRTVTFGPGSQAAEAMAQQHLPRYSVNDASPYWDWDHTPRASSYSADFNSGSLAGWRTYNGNWSASGGILTVSSGDGNRATIEDHWFDDLTYEADVRISSGTGNAGLVFRNANNDYGVDNYRGYYVGFGTSELILGHADNSRGFQSWTPIVTTPINAATNTFHHLKVVAHSGRIQVFFDNSAAPAIDVVDTTSSFGGIGLRTYSTAAAFDNVSVRRNTDLNAYTLSDNFATSQGTKGWRYQQFNGSSYSDLTWTPGIGQWKGSGSFNLAWAPSWLHPDTADTVVSWTAPKAGTIAINGRPFKEASAGDGVNLRVLRNDTQLWPASGWQPLVDTVGVRHSITTAVAAGDVIRFVVNKLGDNTSDATNWNPTIEYSSPVPVGQVIYLKANSNGLNVVARPDEINAPLKAKSSVLGDWEKFQVVDAGGGYVALRALSVSKYVVAWANTPGNPLLANSDALGNWEKLQWTASTDGLTYLRANSNGNYVLARADEAQSPLRATSTSQGDWEKFGWSRYVP